MSIIKGGLHILCEQNMQLSAPFYMLPVESTE